MAMARLGRRRTEAAAPGAPAAGEDLDRVRQKLGASKRLESFNVGFECGIFYCTSIANYVKCMW